MLEDILTGKKSLFETGMQSVLRGQESRLRRIVIQNGNLVTNVRSEESGICARVYLNGAYGFASTAEYTAEAAAKTIAAATKNARYLDKFNTEKKNPYPILEQKTIVSPRMIIDFEQKRLVDLCKEIDAHIEKTYPDLLSRVVAYREDTMEKIIVTSDAADGHVAYPRTTLYVTLNMTSKDGQPVEVSDAVGGFGHIEDNYSDLAKIYEKIAALYKDLCAKAEGVYASAGVKTVILHPDVAGMIAHEAIGHTVEADLVQGGSVAGPNLNKKVASELISITDFASTAFGDKAPLPVYIDDEGTEARDAVLIENGILKGFMHDRESADFYGVRPCGNSRGYAFSDEPLIRMRNTCVHPGKDKLEDMIASVDDGYYLINTGNGQADLTGEFMFGITMGYEIKNGKLGKAILDTTVSGVAFDMLNTVDMVSDTVTWNTSGTCGKKQAMPVSMGGPAIKCKIMIGGR
ncbi:TldD/PmbA family protein [Butyrivibrio sp. LC3010]|uniref:TldD/PmbA family protein n=1 Tax=Butyrivibrio sp. LC3010 TaxID=1280680 RepID=UPI0003FB54B3|nr:TldD/PmbA family protein [Butyrivibrio sp. LC3010]